MRPVGRAAMPRVAARTPGINEGPVQGVVPDGEDLAGAADGQDDSGRAAMQRMNVVRCSV